MIIIWYHIEMMGNDPFRNYPRLIRFSRRSSEAVLGATPKRWYFRMISNLSPRGFSEQHRWWNTQLLPSGNLT